MFFEMPSLSHAKTPNRQTQQYGALVLQCLEIPEAFYSFYDIEARVSKDFFANVISALLPFKCTFSMRAEVSGVVISF